MVFQTVLILLGLTASPDAVHLDYRVTVELKADGSFIERTGISVIPLNGRGVQRYSSMSVSYREGMEEIEILEASVGHWRGGRGSSEGEISTGPHSILTSTNRLESSLRESVITMPGVEVGDTVRITIERRIHELPLSSVYSYSFSPVMDDSVAHSSFQIVNESGISLFSSHSGNYFSFDNVSPASSHPLSAVEDRRISISTGSPARLSREASAALDLPEYGMCSALDEVIELAGTDPEDLRAWVADNINYTGADSGVWPGWSPRSPEETLQDGSGVCRDRSLLLTWLLRKAGYEAYPALATTGGHTPPVADARYFDHMITVYRNDAGEEWELLDPTPRGLPPGTGYSFGLRGCTYLPMVPEGSGLMQIPSEGWNDTLEMSLRGEFDPAEQLINGTLTAAASGVSLELVWKLYTQSDPSLMEEMFRRFFGAMSCDSVAFTDGLFIMQGSWRASATEGYLLLPGLREISHGGSRIASMLLPAPPDSFRVDAPVVEILNLRVFVDGAAPVLPEAVETPGYNCATDFDNGTVILRETADLTGSNQGILESLLLRAGSAQRTVILQ